MLYNITVPVAPSVSISVMLSLGEDNSSVGLEDYGNLLLILIRKLLLMIVPYQSSSLGTASQGSVSYYAEGNLHLLAAGTGCMKQVR